VGDVGGFRENADSESGGWVFNNRRLPERTKKLIEGLVVKQGWNRLCPYGAINPKNQESMKVLCLPATNIDPRPRSKK
jgi:hypothetical protein